MQHIARTSGVANLFVQIVPAFLKWASFSFILGLLKQTKQFLHQKKCAKMSIQYLVFELTTP